MLEQESHEICLKDKGAERKRPSKDLFHY